MNGHILEKQEAVVLAVARAVQSDWKRIACSYEVEESDSSRVQNTIVAFVYQKGDELRNDSLPEIPNAITNAFYDLRAAMPTHEGASWNSAEVTIEADGNYKFGFSYEAPKRINSIFDTDSYREFSRLAEIHKAEREAA